MGELLRSVLGSPEHAEEIYSVGTVDVPLSGTPQDKFLIPTLQAPVAAIEQWLLTAYKEGVVINDDWVIQQVRDRGILTYQDMLDHDPHVFACAEMLIGGAAKIPIQIKPANEESALAVEHADFIRAVLDNFDYVAAFQEIAHGELVGFSVCEIVYDRMPFRGRTCLGVKDILRLNESRILFDYLKRPRLITLHDAAIGVLLQPNVKFLLYRRGSRPYGDGVLMHAFQPYWFKRNGNMFLAKYIEMWGNPPLVGFHANADEQAKVMQALQSIKSSAYASFPANAKEPTVLMPARDSATFNSALSFYNDEISKAIISGTRNVSASDAAGAYSATEVHGTQLTDRQESIIRRLRFVLNKQFIQHLINLNFGKQDAYPVAEFQNDDQETPNDFMTRVNTLATSRMPVAISKKQFYQKSGFEAPTDEADAIEPAALPMTAGPAGTGPMNPTGNPIGNPTGGPPGNFQQARASRRLRNSTTPPAALLPAAILPAATTPRNLLTGKPAVQPRTQPEE